MAETKKEALIAFAGSERLPCSSELWISQGGPRRSAGHSFKRTCSLLSGCTST